MKLSDKSFNYLFKAIATENDKKEIIRKLFQDSVESYFEGEFKLTDEIYKELQKIARECDPDYKCSFSPGEDADVVALFHKGFMYVRLAGDPAPYAEDEEEDEEYGFDAIGEWTVFLSTKEVEFEVDVTT
jgi:hypothetical protein